MTELWYSSATHLVDQIQMLLHSISEISMNVCECMKWICVCVLHMFMYVLVCVSYICKYVLVCVWLDEYNSFITSYFGFSSPEPVLSTLAFFWILLPLLVYNYNYIIVIILVTPNHSHTVKRNTVDYFNHQLGTWVSVYFNVNWHHTVNHVHFMNVYYLKCKLYCNIVYNNVIILL